MSRRPESADVLDRLHERSKALGFLGPGPVASHRRHGRAMVAALADCGVGRAGDVIVDLGSGGGVPGFDVVDAFPSSEIVLAERRDRRADALVLGVVELGAGERATVWTGDVYDLAWSERRGAANAVIARSFGPPAVVAEYSVGLLRPGGWLIVADVDGGDRWPADKMSGLGFGAQRSWSDGWPLVGFALDTPMASQLPRRGSAPRRRPLW